jgi:transcriptional regulator with XRE-family HTH domain
MNKSKGYLSPLERARDSEVRRRVDERKREIYLSTLIIEEMEKRGLTVRQLARCANVSPSTIQSLRSGEAENIGLGKLDQILSFVGRTISFPTIKGQRSASSALRACR